MTRRGAGSVADFLRLAAPMVVSRAGIAGMGLADGVMVARHSPGELALLGLAEGTLGRVLDVLVALLAGGIALAAHALANNQADAAGAVWRRATALALLTGTAAMAAGFAAPWWLGWLGEPPALAAGASPVAAVLGAGMPAALVAVATAMFLEAAGRAPAVAVAIAAANALNVALNWLLIGGVAGLPALGAMGSALSTTLVRLALAAALVAYAWTLPDHARLGVRRRAPGSWRDGALQRRLGYGAAATAALMNALAMCLTVFAGWLGALPLAAVAALWNALSLGMLLALGVADATALRVAAARGRAALAAWGQGLAVMLPALAALIAAAALAPQLTAALYGPQLHDALAALLPLGTLVMLCDGAAFVSAAALRGVGDAVWPTVIQAAVAAVLAPLAWELAIGQGGGAVGLVQAILLTSVLRAALLAGRFWQCAGVKPAPFAMQRP